MRNTATLLTDPVTGLATDPYGLYHLGSEANLPPLLASLGSSVELDPDHW